jgi:hypothetical protein
MSEHIQMSDRPKTPKKPSNIADQFRELQQLRQRVRTAELAAERGKQGAGADLKVGGQTRSPQKPDGGSQTH